MPAHTVSPYDTRQRVQGLSKDDPLTECAKTRPCLRASDDWFRCGEHLIAIPVSKTDERYRRLAIYMASVNNASAE